MTTDRVAVGVDATPDGWVAVRYDDHEYEDVYRYADADGEGDPTAFESLWNDVEDIDADHLNVLVDVPIGLNESNPTRKCDDAARTILSPTRHSSVFPVPVRNAVEAVDDGYEQAKREQETATDGETSLGTQSFAICDRIKAVDNTLTEDATANDCIRESHPEVCFWALNGREPTESSKTGQPAAAFWERVSILEDAVDDPAGFRENLFDAGGTVSGWSESEVANDDLLDAWVLALTAANVTGNSRSLPEDHAFDRGEEPTGTERDDVLEKDIEIVYPSPR